MAIQITHTILAAGVTTQAAVVAHLDLEGSGVIEELVGRGLADGDSAADLMATDRLTDAAADTKAAGSPGGLSFTATKLRASSMPR